MRELDYVLKMRFGGGTLVRRRGGRHVAIIVLGLETYLKDKREIRSRSSCQQGHIDESDGHNC